MTRRAPLSLSPDLRRDDAGPTDDLHRPARLVPVSRTLLDRLQCDCQSVSVSARERPPNRPAANQPQSLRHSRS